MRFDDTAGRRLCLELKLKIDIAIGDPRRVSGTVIFEEKQALIE